MRSCIHLYLLTEARVGCKSDNHGVEQSSSNYPAPRATPHVPAAVAPQHSVIKRTVVQPQVHFTTADTLQPDTSQHNAELSASRRDTGRQMLPD